MPRRIPKNRWDIHIQIPPVRIQIRFITVDRQPVPLSTERVSLPNGHSANSASFNVCNAKGIPIIVTNRIMLEIKYSMAINIPPKSSQIKFPIVFMMIMLACAKILNCYLTNVIPVQTPL